MLNPSHKKMTQLEPTLEKIESSKKHLSLPQFIDWWEMGMVTSVKDQGTCNSHWAIAVADLLESVRAIKDAEYAQPFSTQQLLDCVPDKPMTGCKQNIDVEVVLNYTIKNGIQSA